MTWSDRDGCSKPGHQLYAESRSVENVSEHKLDKTFDELSGALVLEVCSPRKKRPKRQRCLVTSFTIFQSVVEQKSPDGLLHLLKLTSKMFD